MALIDLTEARQLMIDHVVVTPPHDVPVIDAHGWTLAAPLTARITQPPFDASAMDGYAVHLSAPLAAGEQRLVVGEASAGAPFSGNVGPGESVRIFTGSVMPPGTDHVIMQEHVSRHGDRILLETVQKAPANVRKAGVDFSAGDVLAPAGTRLTPVHLSLAAAGNIPTLSVHGRPRLTILCIGDELRNPGTDLRSGQVIESISPGLSALCREWGGEVSEIVCVPDDEPAIVHALQRATGACDIVVIVGGASVGDYDFADAAFEATGARPVFSKVSIKPGKPVWFGRTGKAAVLGLPGNPASALTCAFLFLRDLIAATMGVSVKVPIQYNQAILDSPLKENGPREQFIRAACRLDASAQQVVTPCIDQDSSLLSVFAKSNCLIRRPPKIDGASVGDFVDVLTFS